MVVRVAAAAAAARTPATPSGMGGGVPGGRRRSVGGGRSKNAAAASALGASLVPLLLLLGSADAIWGPALPEGLTVLHASVVMRHGERTRLEKYVSGAEFGDNDGVVLTNKGEQDSYNLGAQLRERYMPINDSHVSTTTIAGLPLFYDAERVQFHSSGYDRTLESATALAFGLYPSGQEDEEVVVESLLFNREIVVPVHSSLPENDPVILAHERCPAFNDNWEETYLSDRFLELEEQATKDQGSKPGFVTQVYEEFQQWNGGGAQDNICFNEAVAFEADKLQYHAPYNLWDCAKTAYAEGDSTAVDIIMLGQLPPEGLEHFGLDQDVEYDDKGWLYLEYLVDEIEDGKYEQLVVGRMVGGLYLTELKQRMSEVREHVVNNRAATVGRFPGMHITSGHYGTLRGIASALDLEKITGIPPYSSHLTFELLYDEAAADAGETDVFSVRILWQYGTEVNNLEFVQMGVVFDASGSEGISDEELASSRNKETGIMPWDQFLYLLEIQNMGQPAIYTEADPEEAWCLDCLAETPNACLRLELQLVEQKFIEAESATTTAVAEKEAVDDGVGGTHLALLSIFGLILGIGIGICIRPCLDRRNSKNGATRAISGDRGLESWASSAGNSVNGSFRLGAKNAPSTRRVNGAVDASQMIPVSTSEYGNDAVGMNGNVNRYDEEDADVGSSSIPSFAPTSALGEPVPFPHRRQPSGMVSGVDSSMMSGIDAEDDGDDDVMGTAATSRELLEFR